MLIKYFDNLLQKHTLAQSWIIKSLAPAQTLAELQNFIRRHLFKTTVGLEYHPDFYLVQKQEAAKDITIDQIRNLQQFLYKTSGLEGSKAAIIYEADLMNLNAASSALKILEEPPANSYVFLISSSPSNLLPTIISRCAKFEEQNLSAEEFKTIINYEEFIDLVASKDVNKTLELLKNLKNKDRELIKILGNYLQILLNRLIKNSAEVELNLTKQENLIMSKFIPGNLMSKFEQVSQIISDCIKYDLDLAACLIILLDELQNDRKYSI